MRQCVTTPWAATPRPPPGASRVSIRWTGRWIHCRTTPRPRRPIPATAKYPRLPPWTSHDKGAPPWGSQPIWSRADDLAFKAAILEALPAISSVWPHVTSMLRHYLGNTGNTVNLDPAELMTEIPEFNDEVNRTIHNQVAEIVAQAVASGNYGKPTPFGTGWLGFYPSPTKYPDWFRAIGGFDYSVGGVVTVYPPSTPGGNPIVHVESQVDIADRYNWDTGKESKIGPLTIEDGDIQALQTAGLAREFNIEGHHLMPTFQGEFIV
ncbi:hypothetical protein NSERKGN1266_53580 [Nocardia seriolae]|nr:hypothetical protein NSERKGN1266_53580 [Nocardia seriolae]BEK94977.1 hypothetical protein NSER024013_28830 [Nocardia seriolae]